MAMKTVSKFEQQVVAAPRNDWHESGETASNYLMRRISELRVDGQSALADLLEQQMKAAIDRALTRFAYQVGRRQLTVRF